MDMSLLRSLFRRVEPRLARAGYHVRWQPRSVSDHPDSELFVSFEHLCAHLLLSKQDLVFLEIGANDGVTIDPLWPFIQRFHWRGIMVEPIPATFQSLTANYAAHPQVHLVNAAIGHTDGQQTIYSVKQHPGQVERANLYASFRKDVVLSQVRYVPNVENEIEELTVPCYTLSTLLDKTQIGPIDILQIDTEGFDAEILKMVDFSRLNPALIQFEHTNLSKSDIDDCARLLIARGYKVAWDSLDMIAYRPIDSLGWR
jgi:FkbM family methyltransferase